MRKILFRGKLINKIGGWSEGNLFIKKDGFTIITPDETILGKYGAVIPESVGEYTGITDMNGKKIFEGDIVKNNICHYSNGDELIGVVEYYKGAFIIKWFPSKTNGTNIVGFVDDIEVIGNIFDNPELFNQTLT